MLLLEQSQLTEARALGAGEHEMVEDSAVERFRGARQTTSSAAIRIARSRIAARVVVSQDESRAGVLGGIGNDHS